MKFWATPVNLPEVLIIAICGIGLFWSFYLGSPSETLIGIFGGYLGAKGNGSSKTTTTTTTTSTQTANSRDRPICHPGTSVSAASSVLNSDKESHKATAEKKSIIDN